MRIAFTHNLQTQNSEEQAEFDTPPTVSAIAGALTRLGHDVQVIEVSGSVARVVARLECARPDLIFNTAEGSRGRFREAFYPALFEQMGIPFTGSDAYVCTVTLDKLATKRLVESHGVPTPGAILVDAQSPLDASQLRFPMVVKPNFEGSSKGITQDSVVGNQDALEACVRRTLAAYPDGALVEEFIEGIDVTVSFLERGPSETAGVLEPAAYVVEEALAAARKHAIYDYALKNELGSAVSVQVPAKLPAAIIQELKRHTATAIRALGVRDLGRADFRVTPEGEIYFIEVNALPSLEPGASLYAAASLAGFASMSETLEAVIESARLRQVQPNKRRRGLGRALRVGLTHNLKHVDPRTGDDRDADYDSPSTIKGIREAIEELGMEVIDLEATPELMSVLPGTDIDLVFNIAEGMGGRNREAQVPAMLELLDIEYTGSDAATMSITLDKALAKRLVTEAGLLTPAFVLMRTGDEPLPEDLTFPVVVKPNAEGSSKGVLAASVIHSAEELRALVRSMQDRYRQPALVESFLPGREFTIGLLGEDTPRALPPMEITFDDTEGEFPVYTFEHKLETRGGVHYVVPAKVDRPLALELERVAVVAFEALGCRDIARVDLRLDGQGRVNFIECNPLPGLTRGYSDLCFIAEGAGLDYVSLIGEIMAPAIRRFRGRQMEGKM